MGGSGYFCSKRSPRRTRIHDFLVLANSPNEAKLLSQREMEIVAGILATDAAESGHSTFRLVD